MSTSLLLLPHLLLAGFQTPPDDLFAHGRPRAEHPGSGQRIDNTRGFDRPFTLAAHRSHSSHASHGSHRSSSGGGYSTPSTPSPVRPYTPPTSSGSDSTAPSSILPNSPAIAPEVQQRLNGNSALFVEVVRQVQLGLYARGYYTGAIDGIAGPMTAAAITAFERDSGLPVTGRVTDGLLNALVITGF